MSRGIHTGAFPGTARPDGHGRVRPPSSFPRKRESMRSRGSGVAESEADWWTILRRFVEDFMGKGLRG